MSNAGDFFARLVAHPRGKVASVFFAAWCLALSANAAVPFEQLLYKGRGIPFYKDSSDPGQQTTIDALREGQLAERMASLVTEVLRLKSDIGVGFESCGQANAFFSPQRRAVVICTEFFQMAGKLGATDTGFLAKQPREAMDQYMVGLLLGVYFHELGHAIIHTNHVPITGREEDVADQFAVWFAVNYVNLSETPIIMPTIWLWTRLAAARSIPAMSDAERRNFLANEHSLDEQRIYNMACWAYGTGSVGGAMAAAFAKLPDQRAARCAGEYARVDQGMRSRFQKYFKVKPLGASW